MLRVRVILLFLLLGIPISFLMAMAFVGWGAEQAYWYEYSDGRFREPTVADMQLWKNYSSEPWQESKPVVFRFSFPGRRYDQLIASQGNRALSKEYSLSAVSDLDDYYPFYEVMQGSIGWPFFCLKFRYWGEAVDFRVTKNNGYDFYYFASEGILPTRVYVGGLLANSLFFGVIAWGLTWLMLIGFSRCRSRRRLAKGLCPSCKYNLKNQMIPGCPECGWNRPVTREAESDPAR